MTEELRELLQEYCESKQMPKPGKGVVLPMDHMLQHPELTEEEFLSLLARLTGYPIVNEFEFLASSDIIKRATALNLPQDPNGYIPLELAGPGIYMGHFDPFVPLPDTLHPHNVQKVLLPHKIYDDARKTWEESYRPQNSGPNKPDPNSIPPDSRSEWMEWQLANGNFPEETTARITEGIAEGAIEKIGLEWQFWFDVRTNGGTPSPVLLKSLRTHPNVSEKLLKQLEGVVLYEDRDIVQIGHVDHMEHLAIIENLETKLAQTESKLQVFKIHKRDYNSYEDSVTLQRLTNESFESSDDNEAAQDVEIIDPRKLAEDAPQNDAGGATNQMLQRLIFQAVKAGASDIHIEPTETHYQIRFCINGINNIFRTNLGKNAGRALINLIKVKGSININERRLPQDGKIRLLIRRTPVELRVVTIPVNDPSRGEETATIRLLAGAGQFASLERVGMSKNHLTMFRLATHMDSGIIIVTGPTGSGKTTTLYAAIQELDRVRNNVLSIEDPIESVIPGLRQTQANYTIGLDFGKALKSFLRAAPQVILVGEIRDTEVSKIAVQAANTGHLVLATLHTNSAAMAIPRLLNLGIEPFEVASSLRLITAQRLLPLLCENCRAEHHPNLDEIDIIKTLTDVQIKPQVYRENTKGCSYCKSGVTGRKMIMEVIGVGKRVRDAIIKNASVNEIEQIAKETCGFTPVAQTAMNGVNAGEYSLRSAQKLITDF